MLTTERILTFTEAARALPPIAGKRCHPSTLWRWARRGCKGVKLEVRRLGGRFVTSMEALERFSKALAEVDPLAHRPEADVTPKGRTDKQRHADVTKAEAELAKAGI